MCKQYDFIYLFSSRLSREPIHNFVLIVFNFLYPNHYGCRELKQLVWKTHTEIVNCVLSASRKPFEYVSGKGYKINIRLLFPINEKLSLANKKKKKKSIQICFYSGQSKEYSN